MVMLFPKACLGLAPTAMLCGLYMQATVAAMEQATESGLRMYPLLLKMCSCVPDLAGAGSCRAQPLQAPAEQAHAPRTGGSAAGTGRNGKEVAHTCVL